MRRRYVIGIDLGTESGRAVLVSAARGEEVASATWPYSHGRHGVIYGSNPHLARQHPADYLACIERTVRSVVSAAKRRLKGFRPTDVIGIGVDTTGSTPIPVDEQGRPLAFQPKFARHPDAMAWLWKDHTAVAEALEITDLARRIRPQFLAKCGGSYSSEWFFSKILHCLRTSPRIFEAAHSWVECSDWVPALLTGNEEPKRIAIGVCAAGHKAMYSESWGGYPDTAFLNRLHPKLGALRARLRPQARTIDRRAGALTDEWAKKTGLPSGIPVAVGAIDAHLGAVGAGIAPGTLVKIIGTSTCDMMIAPAAMPLPDIPGICGMVNGSIVPGYIGLEAGQAAAGDLFNWFVDYLRSDAGKAGTHQALSTQAAKLKPGASGLLALDWNNGNRNVLADQRLTGLILGQTLHTTPAEIYRALIEATAFGALMIINRFEEYRLEVRQVVNCGGIAEKNPLVMQIYADVTGRPMLLSRSPQTCALGAAIAGAVVAGTKTGGYDSVEAAQKDMTGLKKVVYRPNTQAHAVYQKLFALYRKLHDAFGTPGWNGGLFDVMKLLLEIRAAAAKA